MKIAVAVPFEERVPPVKYGGTELVAYNLVENLVKMGHDVTLLASGDSETSAKLHPIFKRSLRSMEEMKDMKMRDSYKFMGVGEVVSFLAQENFDIIHNHIGWRLLSFEGALPCPVVTTLHGPLDVPYQQEVYKKYQNSRYISISLNQRKPLPELNFVGNVYNGIEVEKFQFEEKPKDYFAFLARMSPEKGPVQAIQIAKKAGVKLIMAAKVDAVDAEYFKKEVEPLIDEDQIRFIGEVGHDEKVTLLKNSKGLIAPIQWEEPFGLFFVEAMVCGAPVIAMRRGSVPELVIDKNTGFICDNVDEAVERVGRINEIKRSDCHEHVKANFSSEKMTLDYVKVYEKVLSKK